MKYRIPVYALVTLLAFGIALTLFAASGEEGQRVFGATVNRDCAPWDGPAFSISIPYQPGSIIAISIWQPPDLEYPATFAFPDETGAVGEVQYLLQSGPPMQLSGKVSFWRVEQGIPVTGEFDLRTGSGKHFLGKFKALWNPAVVACG
jgi:hypothetical protein